ncbi:MAG: hypothetical protein ACRDLL_14960 [Solirubrobacterales bacterium]
MDSLDGTIGLRAAGTNETLLGADSGDSVSEGFSSELTAVGFLMDVKPEFSE